MAYHNTEKLFGFQYIPLVEMDQRLFGSSLVGERIFGKCVGLLEAVAEEIVNCFPNEVSVISYLPVGRYLIHHWIVDSMSCGDEGGRQRHEGVDPA